MTDKIRKCRQDRLAYVVWMGGEQVLKQGVWYRSRGRRDSGRPCRFIEARIGH
jgi:hypothetical protein